MSCQVMLFSLFLLSPCSDGGGHGIDAAVAAAVANPQRPSADRTRDSLRKPAEVLTFFGIRPGMTVLDMFSGNGYYTEILNTLVGANGKVIAHTNQAYLPFVGEDNYRKRYANGRLAQTRAVIAEAEDLDLASGSLDAAMLILTWHDFLYGDPENGWQSIDEERLVQKLCMAIKPGGVLGLIDHAANPGGDPARTAEGLHRIDPQVVRDTFANSCFELQAEAGILRNPDDDHTLPVFDKSIRGRTDRFVFRFVRR